MGKPHIDFTFILLNKNGLKAISTQIYSIQRQISLNVYNSLNFSFSGTKSECNRVYIYVSQDEEMLNIFISQQTLTFGIKIFI